MISLFILPYEPTEWKTAKSDLIIDPISYENRLRAQWPKAKIFYESPTYLLRWEILEEEHSFVGGLQSSKQIVEITPYSRLGLCEFVFWHRSVIPDQIQLFLVKEGYWDSLIIGPDITKKEILRFAGLEE